METVTKEMIFDKDFVSCCLCACCYDQNNEPTWCQIFSFNVDWQEKIRNEERAEKCASWVPKGMDRSKVKTPDLDCWYEKDSMG